MEKIEQVGGDHYKATYQHWDWCSETGIGYLEGNATKYLARFRKKHGVMDLKKAQSYIQKLQLVPGVVPARERLGYSPAKLARFLTAAKLQDTAEAALIVAIDSWRTDEDLAHIDSDLGELIRASDH